MKKTIALSICLAISAFFNVTLYINNTINEESILSLSKDVESLRYEIFNLNTIIPKLRSSIDKKELFNFLKAQFPEDRVELLSDHVRWRFFNFWFSDGHINDVTYGS